MTACHKEFDCDILSQSARGFRSGVGKGVAIEADCDMMSLTGASGSITGNAFGITPSGLES